ncbi:hypothetical protein [Streptomyces sp. GESEQ-35]|uniref:hypothetical protein n=1 Tax=Streptomyces sp. GESEQ-35 TaxID=2812657 RepID=UPI001B32F8D6|nr:hypothetical protein [Streptomyces sp. GESEQ-35]
MGTERPLRPGAALALVLLTGCAATGCGNTGAPDGTAAETGAQAGSRSPSAPATPPEDLCTRIVSYWSREVLDSDTYGDYQSMGLSNGQYELLRDVVDAARAERERAGAAAAERLIDREVRAGCTDLYRDGGPTEGPWQ